MSQKYRKKFVEHCKSINLHDRYNEAVDVYCRQVIRECNIDNMAFFISSICYCREKLANVEEEYCNRLELCDEGSDEIYKIGDEFLKYADNLEMDILD